MGYTKTENLKTLHSFYENTEICLTCLSSSRKSADWQNVMFKSLLVLNCDQEVQAFLNMIFIYFSSLRTLYWPPQVGTSNSA